MTRSHDRLPGERAAFKANWGTFRGDNAFAFSGALRIVDHLSLDAGVGFGTDDRNIGARAGLRFGW